MGTEQQTIAQVIANPGVSWELFKWSIGLVLAYATGSYWLLWKLFTLMRSDRMAIYATIKELQTNDIKHLQDDVAMLKGKDT